MLIVISGDGGTGKSTLANNLVKAGLCKRVKTITTRMQRSPIDNEYIFVSEDEFIEKIKKEEFIEHALYRYFDELTLKYKVLYYGTPKKEILDAIESDEYYILVITARGFNKLFEQVGFHNIKSIYLMADEFICRKRMEERGDHNDIVVSRLIEDRQNFNKDYIKLYDIIYYISENEKPDKLVKLITDRFLAVKHSKEDTDVGCTNRYQ